MVHKFTLLLLFSLISLQLDATLLYTETEFSYHFYDDLLEAPLLSIPKNQSNFLEFSEIEYTIHEKLGSYNVEKDIRAKSKHFTITKFQYHKNGGGWFDFEMDYKKEKIKGQFTIGLTKQYGLVFSLFLKDKMAVFNNVTINIPKEYEAIFGGGIQFSHCNLKGQQFPLIVEENGVGRGDKGPTFWAKLVGAAGNEHTTYAPGNTFISNDKTKYKLSASYNHYIDVDFSRNNQLSFSFNYFKSEAQKSIRIEIKNDLSKDINKIAISPLHDWMYSYILGVQGGKEKVNTLIKKLQHNNIKVGAIWIQDWVGKRQTSIGSRLQWDWKANEDVYPNLKLWIDSLQHENIKVLGYINPYFVEGGEQANEGLKNGYFVKTDKQEPYKFKAGGFNAYMIDLNNGPAVEWMRQIIKTNLIDNGFDGWMCDFGEWFPFNNYDKTNSVHITHNDYSKTWVALNTSLAENWKGDSLFIFNRSWYAHKRNVFPNIMWLGDQMGSFGKHDGLGSAVNAYNSASFSGFPIVHSDIGGYTAIKLGPVKHLRNDEVLKRWIEMETFTPIWRSHEGLIPEQMSQIYQDDEMMEFFAYFDSIHQSLIPYFKEVNQALKETGNPMVRHPFLLFPDDKNTFDLQYQFFVGDRLLVCPVIEEGAETVEVYLPKGTWTHFFTKEEFTGGKHYKINAPMGQPAVFWHQD